MINSSPTNPTFSRICFKLKELEQQNNITICFAVESGSKAWGFNSIDSDYDIRFIYFRNDPLSYITVNKQDDTVCGFSEDRELDWQGWDILKAVLHLKPFSQLAAYTKVA